MFFFLLHDLQWSGVSACGGRDGVESSPEEVNFIRVSRNQESALEIASNHPQLVRPAGALEPSLSFDQILYSLSLSRKAKSQSSPRHPQTSPVFSRTDQWHERHVGRGRCLLHVQGVSEQQQGQRRRHFPSSVSISYNRHGVSISLWIQWALVVRHMFGL